jgi:hypothetical protein
MFFYRVGVMAEKNSFVDTRALQAQWRNGAMARRHSVIPIERIASRISDPWRKDHGRQRSC